MLSHIHIGISDFDRAYEFYSSLMRELGLRERFCDPGRSWAGWEPKDAERPLFLIGRAFDGEAATPGNGQMVALLTSSRAAVDGAYAVAIASGAICEGPPGLRPHYHPDYYGTYFRDPDGNKLCVCCHSES
ncbi:MAG: VOC family protein [Phenylobacterium sp.]|uniref:VOC family protein n=1 Tax=Phenylobacterium sp. TaxID=1871053 RepID=UPI00273759EF|nr:VOC family protein [Phenylobacterium sp.]MDP3749599.1 VOC family protein [Phenylobacterium sp.]